MSDYNHINMYTVPSLELVGLLPQPPSFWITSIGTIITNCPD